MLVTTLIGIQTTCVVVATSFVIKHFRPKGLRLKLHSKSNGFKYYKTF